MANIVSPLALKNGAILRITDREGTTREWPTITCAHCGRIVSVRPKDPNDRASPSELLARLPNCRSCMRTTCRSAACVVGCHPFKRDVENAYQEKAGQPWLLRIGGRNEPCFRIYLPDGTEKLIPQAQSGFTERELARMARPSEGKAR